MKTLAPISVLPCENQPLSMRKWFAKDDDVGTGDNDKRFQWMGKTRGETICIGWTTLPLVRKSVLLKCWLFQFGARARKRCVSECFVSSGAAVLSPHNNVPRIIAYATLK